MFLFFFSSRRRHTRSLRDWSSDVCSSDLLLAGRDDHGLIAYEVAHPDDTGADGDFGPGAEVRGQPDRAAHCRGGVAALRPEAALRVAPEAADRFGRRTAAGELP